MTSKTFGETMEQNLRSSDDDLASFLSGAFVLAPQLSGVRKPGIDLASVEHLFVCDLSCYRLEGQVQPTVSRDERCGPRCASLYDN